MREQLRTWLDDIPYHDLVIRRQAMLLQVLELGMLLVALAALPIALAASTDLPGRIIGGGLLGAIMLLNGVALTLLRSGNAHASALSLALGLTILLGILLYGVTFSGGSVLLFAFSLPIAIGGLLVGRRGLLLVLAMSVLAVGLVIVFERNGASGNGFAALPVQPTFTTLVSFALVAMLLGVVIDSISGLGREALSNQRLRERELESLSRRLEAQVRERTADLEMALGNLEQRADDQQRLLDANRRQAAMIRELSVPVLPVTADTLVMPLVGALDDERLRMAQSEALERIEQSGARRLLLDITGVPVVDTFVAQGLIQTMQAARLLGADVALVGVRPEVAQAIVALGIDLGSIRTYADLHTALSRTEN
jgi:rsbT co-antagonist protein RsbR